MEMFPVGSSTLEAIGYGYPKRVLRVKFNSGRIYDYKDVEPDVFLAFLKAPSKGSYFDKSIRNCGYPFQRIS